MRAASSAHPYNGRMLHHPDYECSGARWKTSTGHRPHEGASGGMPSRVDRSTRSARHIISHTME